MRVSAYRCILTAGSNSHVITLKVAIETPFKNAAKMKGIYGQSDQASAEDSLVHDRDGWRFIAIAMLIVNVIWLVFGVMGYILAGMVFR